MNYKSELKTVRLTLASEHIVT